MVPRGWVVIVKILRVVLDALCIFLIGGHNRKIVCHDDVDAGIVLLDEIECIFLPTKGRHAGNRRMVLIQHPDLQHLKLGVPRKGATEHEFEPTPVSFGSDHRVQANESTTCLNISPERQALSVRIKHIIVGAGKYYEGVLCEIFLRKYGGVVSHI